MRGGSPRSGPSPHPRRGFSGRWQSRLRVSRRCLALRARLTSSRKLGHPPNHPGHGWLRDVESWQETTFLPTRKIQTAVSTRTEAAAEHQHASWKIKHRVGDAPTVANGDTGYLPGVICRSEPLAGARPVGGTSSPPVVLEEEYVEEAVVEAKGSTAVVDSRLA